MRTISADALQTLATSRGTEPILIVGIQWVQGGDILLYSEKAIEGRDNVRPSILELGIIDSTLAISLNETSDSIGIVLSDTDGHLKQIINTQDIHKRNIYIWQWFSSLPWDDRFLVFQGKINSPIAWKDSDRTLEFTGVSQLEDNEVGFTLEEGTFTEEDLDDLVGKTWPECFGTTIHQKALKIDNRYTGSLGESIGIADFTLPALSASNYTIASYLLQLQVFWALMGAYLRFIGLEEQGDSLIDKANQFGAQAVQFRQKGADALATYDSQKDTELSQVRIVGGENFPRGLIELDIGGAIFRGSFSGEQYADGADIFTVQQACHPALEEYCFECGEPVTQSVGTTSFTFEDVEGVVQECKIIPVAESYSYTQVTGDVGLIYTGNILGETAGPFSAAAGADVKLNSVEPQRYIVSITPGRVIKVAAFTTLDSGERILIDIPEDYYRVYRQSFGTVTATIIETTDALSKFPAPGWEDTIYVTYQSNIGPNPVDIISYLINRYTSFGIDPISFNQVRTYLAPYNMNFCVPGRKNIFTILKELTFQARCAIFLRNGLFYLVYLPAQPTSVHTFTEDNVDTNSVEVGFTETEDLITSFVGTWRAHGAQEEDNKVIHRYNVKKYGTHKFEFDYYAYNYIGGVIKSMTYWIMRRGNTWKTLKFNASLDALNTEVFDGILCDFTSDYVSNSAILGLVESADYQADTNTISFSIWTGVRVGEMESYAFNYPQGVSQTLVFPTPTEQAAGNAGGGTINNRAGGVLERRGPRSGINVQWNDNDPHGAGNRRNSDKGGKLSDGGDNGPGQPQTNETGQYEFTAVPPPSPGVSSASIVEPTSPTWIDIRITKIYDSLTQQSTTFDTFFEEISNNKLHGKTAASWKDGSNTGEFDFKWDEDKFGAGTAFLQD